MSWNTLTHGWYGLTFGWLVVAIPLWIALAQNRAPPRKWLRSPVLAAILLIVSGILMDVVFGFLKVNQKDPGALTQLTGMLCYALTGYIGGRIASRRPVSEAHKRGSLIRHGAEAQRQKNSQGPITLAGIALSPEDETKHFKLIGTTGTGKSTAIQELLAGALERGDRAVIADPDGGFAARHYDFGRGDVILNPFDPRSLKWDPFAEIREPYDIENLAGALIPSGEDGAGRDWRGYARTFLTALLKRCCQTGQRELAELWRLLAVASAEDLRPVVAGTPAQPFLDAENARMFGSIRSVAASTLGGLEYIQSQRAAPFSVRDWVRSSRHGVLFMPYQASQIAAVRTTIAAWLRLAIFEALSQPQGDQRLWFIVDELDALGAIEGLKDALVRLRRFGGRCVLGFQSIAQVSTTYGAGEAQTIVENCGNTLILRCSSSEGGGTSRFASGLIGDRELIRR